MNCLSINIRGIGGVHKAGWIKSLVRGFGINFLAIQESKHNGVTRAGMSKFWGHNRFGMESVDASGVSGGLVCLWDENCFQLEESVKDRHFLHLKGRLVGCNRPVNFLSVYAPQGIAAKKEVWDALTVIINNFDGFWIIGDDFNAALPRLWSDHCPIILISKSVNFGARPFRVFNSWLGKEGFSAVVEEACRDFSSPGCSPDVFLVRKLGFIRSKLREWRDKMVIKEGEERSLAEEEISSLESILEFRDLTRDLTEEVEWVLAENKNVLAEIELAKVMDLRQRSRVRWAREGDENSKFFHSMVNCRKASNSLSTGSMLGANGSKFVEECEARTVLSCPSLKRISVSDADWLESQFSVDEIKSAVFECGDDRAPRPDGFNFRFFKRFWNLFEQDFVSLLAVFFETGIINPGCGSSFITLVPKIKDPSGLDDYRPISLVGVVNKVISKVLANRLKKVIASVISDNQSAFLRGRFILDGPLIINEVCSGLKINLGKSNLYGIGVDAAEVGAMTDIVGCKQDSLLFKYLGLKVGANMNRVVNWRPVYDIFESRLALWKSALLSFGGRITLIRSVLVSLPIYYFSLYKAPVKVVKDLECLIKKFLWGGSSEVNKTHWVAWDRITIDKKHGGLGISKLSDINRALLCKWGWRFKREKEHLWVKVVEAIHSGGSSWSFLPVKKSLGGVWNNIVSVINRPLIGNSCFRDCLRGKAGRGDCISFWLDPWLLETPLMEKFPNLFALETVKNCSVRDRVLGVWLWKHDPELVDELGELIELNEAVASVLLNDSEDVWVWLPDQANSFSVRSIKKVMSGSSVDSSRYVLEWNKWIPMKCNFFVWRASLNRIPTLDALRRRGINVGDGLCPLCKTENETVEHIFTSCITVAVLWQKISAAGAEFLPCMHSHLRICWRFLMGFLLSRRTSRSFKVSFSSTVGVYGQPVTRRFFRVSM
ncbi:uncharacterized protein LOC110888906 [Helianthus annuus]|uniref:uncharacterized protein LOC110888906 n=1 Tax=Helianthus annuus TaxID=4232 RepID=UPI000B903E62|nr:uncharacterized protein LOC110888906 [Helianthus annuus]